MAFFKNKYDRPGSETLKVPPRKYDFPMPDEEKLYAQQEAVKQLLADEGVDSIRELPVDLERETDPEAKIYVPALGKSLSVPEYQAFREMWESGRHPDILGRYKGFDPENNWKLTTLENERGKSPEVFESGPMTEREGNVNTSYASGARDIARSKDKTYRSEIAKILKDTLGAGEIAPPPGMEVVE